MPEIIENLKPALTQDQKLELIQELRELVSKSIYTESRTDDIFLMRFLHCCEWDVDQAYKRIVKIMQHRRNHPTWFINDDATSFIPVLKENIKTVLEKRDKNGRRVYVTKLGNIKPHIKASDMAQLDDLWFNTILDEPETIEKGVSVIIDMKNASWRIMKLLSPGNIKTAATSADLTPISHMEFHIVNSSAILNSAVTLIFPFLGQRLKDQVHFHHSNMKSMHEFLGRECLPEEYGGEPGSKIEYEQLHKQLTIDFGKGVDYKLNSVENITQEAMKENVKPAIATR
ncbi:alpha-tocopherol transfer protein-like [Culicoides brevitarsis]|uniref:alpha-tocopherol transfer protein-like n=1 Tax=Culicoides brevitarsis TaxID=469753 RepID=UPI00307BE5F3